MQDKGFTPLIYPNIFEFASGESGENVYKCWFKGFVFALSECIREGFTPLICQNIF